MDNRPLAGLLVLSVEQAVAAPFCTSRLADAGARVVKIERPEGDFARGYDRVAGGESSYFVWLNRGKESIALDLNDDRDRDLLLSMIDKADVFVQNLKPGALDRKGLGPQDLCARNPRLIACSISGYGETGPYADRKAYDLLIQAESGLCSITGGPDAPARVGISVVDIATGAAAHAAILEALIGRAVSGRGADIRISMFDVIADWLTVPLLHARSGNSPQRIGLAHPSISPYGVFTTADGKNLLISIQNDREWRNFVTTVLHKPDLATGAGFKTNEERVSNRAAVDAEVAAAVGRHDMADMTEILRTADIAFAGVNSMNGLIDHPQLSLSQIGTPGGTQVKVPAPAARFDGNRYFDAGTMPALNQHGTAIRAEFGGG